MTNRELNAEELSKINQVLTDANFEEITEAVLDNIVTEDGKETSAILRYNPNTDATDATLGGLELGKAGLEINYDGNPETTEHGYDYDTKKYVIMVKLPLFPK